MTDAAPGDQVINRTLLRRLTVADHPPAQEPESTSRPAWLRYVPSQTPTRSQAEISWLLPAPPGDAQLRRDRLDRRILGRIVTSTLDHQAQRALRKSLGYGFGRKIIVQGRKSPPNPGGHWEPALSRYTKVCIPEANHARARLTANPGDPPTAAMRPPARPPTNARIATRLSCQTAPWGARPQVREPCPRANLRTGSPPAFLSLPVRVPSPFLVRPVRFEPSLAVSPHYMEILRESQAGGRPRHAAGIGSALDAFRR